MQTNRRLIAAKPEAVEGTGETLLAADGGILALNVKVDVDIKMLPRNVTKASLGKRADVPGSRLARITFRAEMKGPGSAYSTTVKPALSPYLRGCGYAETVDATPGTEKTTYVPASTGAPSLTIWSYEDGVIKKLIGCRGNVKFSTEAGGIVYADFDFIGVWDGLVDGAMLAPTFEGTTPPVFLNGSFTIDSYAAIIKGFNIDRANKLYLRESANASSGYLSAVITDRDFNGSIDPEMVLKATYDWYGKWQAGTPGALSIGYVGATQYNKFKITGPKAQYRKVSDADREGQTVADTAFQLAENTGDDEMQIEFA
ncbi:MAG: hypothetical protein OEV28_08515 [Nitrospirota bacterium]|nr:hypothetical protein [Nitrospirota bacterium]